MQDFVLKALRRASLRWPARTKVKQAARVGRNRYQCAECEAIVPNKGISVDHVAPVVDPETGFTDWNTYVARLFVAPGGLRCLCKACHSTKTRTENARRREVAKKKRKPKEAKAKRARKRKGTETNRDEAGPPLP